MRRNSLGNDKGSKDNQKKQGVNNNIYKCQLLKRDKNRRPVSDIFPIPSHQSALREEELKDLLEDLKSMGLQEQETPVKTEDAIIKNENINEEKESSILTNSNITFGQKS